jgi:hypothetical protein
MLRTASIPIFTALILQSTAALAQSDGEWFGGEEQTPQASEEAAPAEEAEAEAEPAKPAKTDKADKANAGAKAKAETKVVVVTADSDPVKDEASETPKRKGVRTHDGFYLRMSLGGGSIAARGDRYDAVGTRSEYSFEGNALSADLLIGGSPMPGFAIGGAYLTSYAARERDAEGDTGEGGDAGMSFGMIGPFVDIYPDPRGGFHLGGMVGPAATVTYDDRYEERTAAVGFGGSLWLGYDFWIGEQWSLGGVLRASAARVETPPNRDLQPDEDRLGVGSVALLVSATYH